MESERFIGEMVRQIFGEALILPAGSDETPVLAQCVAKVTPAIASKRAMEHAPTIGEELVHLLSTIESYLSDCAPGKITRHEWGRLVADGGAYEAFEELRHEVAKATSSIQLEREMNYRSLGRPVSVRDVLLHLADHTAHHRGRLSLLMRLCGVEPPEL